MRECRGDVGISGGCVGVGFCGSNVIGKSFLE